MCTIRNQLVWPQPTCRPAKQRRGARYDTTRSPHLHPSSGKASCRCIVHHHCETGERQSRCQASAPTNDARLACHPLCRFRLAVDDISPGRVGGRDPKAVAQRSDASHSATAAWRSASSTDEGPLSLSDPQDMLPSSPRVSDSARNDSASFSAAWAAVSSAARRCLGELGGEKVGEGDDGVGGSAVSFHTRCVTSCSPSAAARVSRSSSNVDSELSADVPPFISLPFCRFGELGGEHVGEGDLGVGGRLRSSTPRAKTLLGSATWRASKNDSDPEEEPISGGGGDRASGICPRASALPNGVEGPAPAEGFRAVGSSDCIPSLSEELA